MRIVLIAGKSGTGKNHVAQIMKEFLEENQQRTVITEYSKYIKLFAKEMLGWRETDPKKPREFLQEIGSFIREDLGKKDLFIERMKTDISVYERFFENVIICDIRYPEEIDEIKKTYSKVTTILIEKEEQNPELTMKEAAHITEHALENYQNFDYIIQNENEKELKRKVLEIMEEII